MNSISSGDDGKPPEIQDTSQGPILQAGLSKDCCKAGHVGCLLHERLSVIMNLASGGTGELSKGQSKRAT